MKNIEIEWNCFETVIKDDKTFEDYKIEDDDTIEACKQVVGGGCVGFGIETIYVTKKSQKY